VPANSSENVGPGSGRIGLINEGEAT